MAMAKVENETATGTACKPAWMQAVNHRAFLRLRPSGGSATRVLWPLDCVRLRQRMPGAPEGQLDFAFCHVFGEDSSQHQIWSAVGQGMVRDQLMRERDGLLCVLGPIGSGRHYTLAGDGTARNNGLLQKSLELLFALLQERDGNKGNGPKLRRKLLRRKQTLWHVYVSYTALHKDNAYDLLTAQPKALNICEQGGDFSVANESQPEIFSANDGLKYYEQGQQHRCGQLLPSNAHAIFTIRLVQAPLKQMPNGGYDLKRRGVFATSRFSLVQLASDVQDNSLKELRRCLGQLRLNAPPNYGKSKLMLLLRSYLAQKRETRINLLLCVNGFDACTDHMKVLSFAEYIQVSQAMPMPKEEARPKQCNAYTQVDGDQLQQLQWDNGAQEEVEQLKLKLQQYQKCTDQLLDKLGCALIEIKRLNFLVSERDEQLKHLRQPESDDIDGFEKPRELAAKAELQQTAKGDLAVESVVQQPVKLADQSMPQVNEANSAKTYVSFRIKPTLNKEHLMKK